MSPCFHRIGGGHLTQLHILYENPAWLPPLISALERKGVPFTTHLVTSGSIDLSQVPAEGIYLNRMSPSAHTRGNQGGVRLVTEMLRWLEANGRRVLNGTHAFDLELSKSRQDLALRAAGILTPKTVVAVGLDDLKRASRTMTLPFIIKHNQGGKGLGVRLFNDLDSFDDFLLNDEFEDDPNGVNILQEYIRPPWNKITRVEIVDGEFIMAIDSDTSEGFQLCPAVECSESEDGLCPIDGRSERFSPSTNIRPDDPLVEKYIRMMRHNSIDIAGIEFVEDELGRRYTYDINCTTNFNQSVESELGIFGMDAVAGLVKRILDQQYPEQVCFT